MNDEIQAKINRVMETVVGGAHGAWRAEVPSSWLGRAVQLARRYNGWTLSHGMANLVLFALRISITAALGPLPAGCTEQSPQGQIHRTITHTHTAAAAETQPQALIWLPKYILRVRWVCTCMHNAMLMFPHITSISDFSHGWGEPENVWGELRRKTGGKWMKPLLLAPYSLSVVYISMSVGHVEAL